MLRGRLTFANVVSMVALVCALGLGTAWAATELGKDQVRSKHIADGQVKRSDLAESAVPTLAEDAVVREETHRIDAATDLSGETVECNSGETATAGNWSLAGGEPHDLTVRESLITTDGDGRPSGYTVTARNEGRSDPLSITIQAVCVSP